MFDQLIPAHQLVRKNTTFEFTGMDSLALCKDKDWFLAYTDPISYTINNWGFRDRDQNDISGRYVAVGDSFTLGLGQPFDQIWSKQLASILQEDVINLSLDGASNTWIIEILKTILPKKPKAVFVMLSFAHRELQFNKNGTVDHLHLDLLLEDKQMLMNKFLMHYKLIRELEIEHQIPILVSAIPNFDLLKFSITNKLNIIKYKRLMDQIGFFTSNLESKFKKINDIARDGYHFGPKTSREIAENFSKALLDLPNNHC